MTFRNLLAEIQGRCRLNPDWFGEVVTYQRGDATYRVPAHCRATQRPADGADGSRTLVDELRVELSISLDADAKAVIEAAAGETVDELPGAPQTADRITRDTDSTSYLFAYLARTTQVGYHAIFRRPKVIVQGTGLRAG